MTTIATPSPLLTELAGILARGYLRLTGVGQKVASSGHNALDLPAKESPPVIETGAHHGNNDAP